MTLQEYIDTLPQDKRIELGITLAKIALPIWEQYAQKNELTYQDTVVGLHHSVDRDLLGDTIKAVEQHFNSNTPAKDFAELREQFDDPIVALQDADWILPNEIKLVFYSVFNLLEACSGKERTIFGDLTIYVSINQAVDAIEKSGVLTFDELKAIIYKGTKWDSRI